MDSNKILESLFSGAVGFLFGVLGTLFALWIQRRVGKQHTKEDLKERLEQERLDPTVNIVRNESYELGRLFGIKGEYWRVNPYWVDFRDDDAQLMHIPNLSALVIHKVGIRKPLEIAFVEQAKSNQEWLIFEKVNDRLLGEHLIFMRTLQRQPDQAHLFKELSSSMVPLDG